MPAQKNLQEVKELEDKLSRCTVAVVTGFQGLKVAEMVDLRKKLREAGIDYRVAKNTLTFLAADRTGKSALKVIIQGPSALALGYGEAVEVAKALDEYMRTSRTVLVLRGALLDGRTFGPEQFRALATLPPRSRLLADTVGGLMGPLYGLGYAVASPLAGLVGILQGRLQQLEREQRA